MHYNNVNEEVGLNTGSKKLVLCVTGNGRSGTSLVASFLDKAGIPMGIEMRGAGKGCRLGFFEDVDFLEFQKAVLKRNGSGLYFPWKKVVVNSREREVAAEMIAARSRRWDRWGWKDPRSTLFLHFWVEMLPDARFLIMYREPQQVITSVYRQMHRYLRYPRPDLAPRSWLYYNRYALGFARRYPDKVAVMNIQELKSNPVETISALSQFLGVELDVQCFSEVYQPSEMTAHNIKLTREPFISSCLKISKKIWGREMEELYAELESVSLGS